MRIFYTICLMLAVLLGGPSFLSAFDFDDLEKLEKAEQEDLLAKASQAARNWNFSEATSFLNQARNKGYAPTEIKAVEQLIVSNQSAKAEKERREEEARQAQIAAAKAEEERRENERRRVAARDQIRTNNSCNKRCESALDWCANSCDVEDDALDILGGAGTSCLGRCEENYERCAHNCN